MINKINRGFLLLLNSLLLSSIVNAQERPQWDDIPAGPYDIGFKVFQTHDFSRGYWPEPDNSESNHETARPIQISMWYPAKIEQQAEKMIFGDYIEILPSELGEERVTEKKKKAAYERLRRGPLDPYFDGVVTDNDLQKVFDTPIPATKNAEAEAGPFPLIIHAGFGLLGQSVLNEYLASQGYVVVAFPVLSTHPAWYDRGEGNMEWYHEISRDIGFILSEMRAVPFADHSNAAVIGMFAASGYIYQMQYRGLNAIASLDGRFPDVIQKAPGFDFKKIGIPVLDMPSSNNTQGRSVLDSIQFAPRYTITFESVTHGDFYQFQRIANPEKSEEAIEYKIIARYTRAFLNAVLKNDEEALHFLMQKPEDVGAPSDFMKTDHLPALALPPTENDFLLMVRNGDVDGARKEFQSVKKDLPRFEICSESSLRTVALFYRRDHGAEASLEVFKLWADLFPGSWNAKNQLGITYAQSGKYLLAINIFEETISLVDQNDKLSDKEKSARISELRKEIERLKSEE